MSIQSAISQADALTLAASASMEKSAGILDRIFNSREAIVEKCLQKLRPDVIQEIQASWAGSGIKSVSGVLATAINNPQIRVTKRGISISLPPGLDAVKNPSGKSTYSVYKQAGALKYGALTNHGGTITAHPFFKLDASAIQRLQQSFNRYMNQEIGAVK